VRAIDCLDGHRLSVEQTLECLATSAAGLTELEVRTRSREVGPNRLDPARPESAWKIFIRQFSSVMVLLLAVGTALAAAMGDRLEALAIAAVLAVNAGLGFVIDLRARRAMEALARLDQGWCLAWRDGVLRRVLAEQLVPGDLIQLEAGKTAPADARLVSTDELHVSEAVLTGESLPVAKDATVSLDPRTPLADRVNMIFKGTIVLAGTGCAAVTATGRQTEVGRIGAALAGMPEERTPLERRLDDLGRHLAVAAIVVSGLVASLGRLQGLSWGRLAETAIALVVAAVPEGLPAVVTIALAVGLRRMAARHALVRRLPAVEALGSVTVVCTDKTRTLTSGVMTAVRLWTAERDLSLEDSAGSVDDAAAFALEVAALACQRQAPQTIGEPAGDPVEIAIVEGARACGIEQHQLLASRPAEGVVPFSSGRRYMAAFRRSGDRICAYVKGAPVRVLALCDRELVDGGTRGLGLDGKRRLLAVNRAMAADGLHVLALATGDAHGTTEGHARGLTFVGFVGLLDPPAAGVRDTLSRLRDAGLKTIMLTGDQRATALAVGRRLGIAADSSAVLEGRQAENCSDAALAASLSHIRILSRVTPATKLAVVRALQQRGEIVAMLGDGVNDAAALKKADVGVTMGRRGTDVARDASSIVLEDDRFDTIAAAVEEGRVIYDNVRRFVFYLFSCNIAEILVVLALSLLGMAPLLPLQILWLNLVTDTTPALALVMEPADPDVMRRPPTSPHEAILSRSFVAAITAYALLLTAATMGAVLAIDDPTESRVTTVAFLTLAFAEVLHLGNARGPRAVLHPSRAFANRYAVAAVVFTVCVQIGVMAWDPAQRLLHLTSLTAWDWMIVAVASAATAVAGQTTKLLRGDHGWRLRFEEQPS
jgi:Ca2+-transporting ATPase